MSKSLVTFTMGPSQWMTTGDFPQHLEDHRSYPILSATNWDDRV